MRKWLAAVAFALAASALAGAVNAQVDAQAPSQAPRQTQAQDRVLDDFENLADWKVSATDDAHATLRQADGPHGKALCIDFDFGRVTGYISAQRTLPIDYPARYEFTLDVRGDAPPNALQFKLVDDSGENVWWGQRPEFRFPAEWQTLRFRQRQIEFAWGPTADKVLRRTASVELVIASSGTSSTSGTSGGGGGASKGSACFDRLTLRQLPDVAPAIPAPVLRADGLGVDFGLPREFGALGLRWQAGAAASRYAIELSDDGVQWRRVREVDREVERMPGELHSHWLPDSEARFVRVVPEAGALRAVLAAIEPRDAPTANAFFTQLAKDAPRGQYPRAYAGEQSYWTVLGVDGARTASLLSEDGVLEPVPGVGALEPFLIADSRPLSWADATITHTLRDGDLPMPAVHWKLRDPARGDLTLDIQAFGHGTPEAAQALARYTVRNLGKRTRAVSIALAWRPFQANPPTQFLTHPGGASAVERLAWDGRVLGVNDQARLQPLSRPDSVQLHPFAAGSGSPALTLALSQREREECEGNEEAGRAVGTLGSLSRTRERVGVRVLDARRGGPALTPALSQREREECEDNEEARPAVGSVGALARARERAGVRVLDARGGRSALTPALSQGEREEDRSVVVDPAGFAIAVLRYELRLAPGESRSVAVALPVSGTPIVPTMASFAREEQRVAAGWRERLDRVRISGPGEVADVAATLRAGLGHILVNRSGPALQPGARAYARSWIRDGALTSAALLRLGHADAARDFLQWFAPFQFSNGKVPCCATARGADPVPENDSDGAFAFAVADLWHHTHDEATVRALWPNVRAAVEHMETLRQSERTEKNRPAERSAGFPPSKRLAYFGMMPPSISHEGYSDKPAYSYWDNFWASTGYRSAVELAQALKLPDDAARIAAQRDEFGADLLRSLTASTAFYKMNVLPGAADRGDVDPTSSTIALSPGGLLGVLPHALVRNTFDRYWRDFSARLADEAAGVRHGDGAYTPYEWRNVGALVRLGERERALAAMAYFYRDRRPAGWKQWAEVVVRDAREPRFLGDMPHGWVASDQIRAVLDLFAYEHEGERRMVLAAGVPLAWFEGPGLTIAGLRTPYGPLGWHGRARTVRGNHTVRFDVEALRDAPPGGTLLRGPWPADARVWIDGATVPGPADAIPLQRTPARVRIEWPTRR